MCVSADLPALFFVEGCEPLLILSALFGTALMVAISYSAFCLSTLGIFGHLSAQVQNLGMSSHVGAAVVSAAGFAGMAVRPAFGFLADRFCGKRTLLILLATLLSVLFLVWNICSTPETAILFGCALGVLFNAFYTVLAG